MVEFRGTCPRDTAPERIERRSASIGVWFHLSTTLPFRPSAAQRHLGTDQYLIALSDALDKFSLVVKALVATNPDTAVLQIDANSASVDSDRSCATQPCSRPLRSGCPDRRRLFPVHRKLQKKTCLVKKTVLRNATFETIKCQMTGPTSRHVHAFRHVTCLSGPFTYLPLFFLVPDVITVTPKEHVKRHFSAKSCVLLILTLFLLEAIAAWGSLPMCESSFWTKSNTQQQFRSSFSPKHIASYDPTWNTLPATRNCTHMTCDFILNGMFGFSAQHVVFLSGTLL